MYVKSIAVAEIQNLLATMLLISARIRPTQSLKYKFFLLLKLNNEKANDLRSAELVMKKKMLTLTRGGLC